MSKQVSHADYNNDWFKKQINASKLKQALWFISNVLFLINPLNPSSGIKKFFLRIFGAEIGQDVVCKPGINIKYPWKLKIGDHTWIGEKVWIDNLAEVQIGKNCCLSQGAMLLTGNHNYSSPTFDLSVKKIVLEDGVWIGAQAVVCPGITCGSHSVLSVQSVATKDLEPYNIYQGNPAILIKERVIE
jgi:putative colanic acid biosynthesis acetyltransferase WcaF